VFLGRACLLALDRCEFGARVFRIVLVRDDAVRKFFEFGIALADVLVEACDAVVGNFELLSKRLGVRLVFLEGVVSLLTRRNRARREDGLCRRRP